MIKRLPKSFIPLAIIVFFVSFFFGKDFFNTPCANSISCIKDLTGSYKSPELKGEFMGKKVDSPLERHHPARVASILGDSTVEKHIEIDLTNQKLYGIEGESTVVFDYPISSGKWGRTPTGEFRIWVKLNYTTMRGGSRALGTYYHLPNVPYTMFFYNQEIPKSRGYGIHGTYWHDNFGHPMSHGCINMRTEDVERLYAWANPPSIAHTTYAKGNEGTKIVIYGEAPYE